MKRANESDIQNDLKKKIVLLTGPRQSGKTFLSRQLCDRYDYFSYDLPQDRLKLMRLEWERSSELLIFDELHKMKKWKQWLKGVYDTQGIPPKILVTGSARLDIARKMGDSLAGRFFQHRLYPLDLKELKLVGFNNEVTLERLFICSGFPEPFLENNQTYYRKWQKSHLDLILRQDLLDFQQVKDIVAIETLIALLRQRVGATISYANLARDLGVDPTTVKRWLALLENLYVIFQVPPYSKKLSRLIRKESKYYFYDVALPESDNGTKLENVVAGALLKELHHLEDQLGLRTHLHFLRTKDGHEMDFLVLIEGKPILAVEVKWADKPPPKSVAYFQKHFPGLPFIQLVQELNRPYSTPTGLSVIKADTWLQTLDLLSYHTRVLAV